MPSKIVYLDSCVFLSYLNETEGRTDAIQSLFDQAERGEIAIRTSMVSLTEAAYVEHEKANGELDTTIESALDDLFFDTSVVLLVEFHRLIAEQARNLIRRAMIQKRSIQGMDAVHLATAINEGASVLYTYDKKVRTLAPLFGLVAEEPNALVQGVLGQETSGPVAPA